MAQKQYPIINNFSKGELSSRMEGRVDIQGYYNGCKQMENCIMVAQGGAEKRPGTIYVGETLNSNIANLLTFEVNDDELYVLELTKYKMRIWNTITNQIEPDPIGSGNDYIVTEYSEEELFDIQTAQTEGSIFFANVNHAVQQLTKDDSGFKFNQMVVNIDKYDSSANYKFGDIIIYDGNYYKAKRDVTNIEPTTNQWEQVNSGPTDLSGDISVWSPGSYTVGSYVVWEESLWRCEIDATTQEPGIPVQSLTAESWSKQKYHGSSEWCANGLKWLNDTYGEDNWKVDVSITYCPFGGYQVWYRTKIKNYETLNYWTPVIGLPDIASPYSLVSYVAGTYNSYNYVYDPSTYVIFRSRTDGNTSALASTYYWGDAESNPLLDGNFPTAITFMGNRLYLGGTKTSPHTFMASKVGDYNNFTMGVDDDDAFSFTIAADRSSRIKWMVAKDVLYIGTTTSEWIASGLTPTSIQVLRQSAYGSEYMQALFVADALLFYQKGGRKLREYIYSNDNKTYLAPDLTFFSDHITKTGIYDASYQYNPDSILWSTRKDGELIGVTYNRLNNIAGWHHHTTNGLFESVASIDSQSDEDKLWFVVNRYVNGTTKRYVEYMSTREIKTREAVVYSDSAKVYVHNDNYNIINAVWSSSKITITVGTTPLFTNGNYIKINFTSIESLDRNVYEVSDLSVNSFSLKIGGEYLTTEEFIDPRIGTVFEVTDTVSGLDHLEGKSVVILGDGAVFPNETVVSGSITIASKCHTIIVGLEYTMRLVPESIELQGTIGSKRRISKATLKLYKTLGGYIGKDENNLEELRYRSTNIPFGVSPDLYTGTIDIPVDTSSEAEASIMIYHNQPLPMTVLAIITDISYSRS